MTPPELAAVAQLAPSPETRTASKSLVTKLLAVIQEIPTIAKRGFNNFNGYSFATAEDIINAVRGPLAKHGVLVYASLKDRAYETIKTAQGKDAWREAITLRFVVTDGESEIAFDVPGEGQDFGDKAIFKAITGAEKYGLRLLLHLPFGDDPEADSMETKQHQQGKSQTKPVPREAPKAVPTFAPRPAPPLLTVPPPPPSLGKPPAPAPTEATREATPPGPPVPPGPPKATEKQIHAIYSLKKALGVDDERFQKVIKERYGVESPEGLSKSQASELLDLMKGERQRYPRS
jgi:hypothetical protein